MSWARVPWGVIDAAGKIGPDGKKIGPYALAAYCAIARHADSNGYAWPSMSTIASVAGMSVRTAREAVRALESAHLLSREFRYKANNEADSTLYRLAKGTAPDAAPTAPDAAQVRHDMPVGTAPDAEELEPLNKNQLNKRKRAPEFVPPTVEEVKAYATEKGLRIDAEYFIDHYTSNGWHVGRNPMRNWRATVNKWTRNSFNNPNNHRDGKPSAAPAKPKQLGPPERKQPRLQGT